MAYWLWYPNIKKVRIGIDVNVHETLGFQTKEPIPQVTKAYLDIVVI